MRIAILAHSTNPRGGVAHALALGEALTAAGHEAVVHAPDAVGDGFFRAAACEVVALPVGPAPAGTAALVARLVADYENYFAENRHRRFDVFHAQDSISGNALAAMRRRGEITRFARTVHHIDDFADPMLAALQAGAITAAAGHFTVSRQGQRELAARFGVAADVVGNGVDRRRYTPRVDASDGALRNRLGLAGGPVFLSVGGVEARKNTARILLAFDRLRLSLPAAQLVIAGGASLLDHGDYQQHCAGLPQGGVCYAGVIPDALMPALYRAADVLVFASVREGFGLAVLEAMACGVPVVVGAIPPFTEYLAEADVAWCDPLDIGSIAGAMAAALVRRHGLAARGAAVAARHGWDATAAAHLPGYARLRELADA